MYKIGDRFQYLGCGPHVITAVVRSGTAIEYTADYVGIEGDKYWECKTYGHNSIVVNNNLNN